MEAATWEAEQGAGGVQCEGVGQGEVGEGAGAVQC
jgi:hypothetical protein